MVTGGFSPLERGKDSLYQLFGRFGRASLALQSLLRRAEE